MKKNDEIKTAVISFFIPLAGLYLTAINRLKDPVKSQLAQKWMLIGFAASLTAGVIGWMYYGG